MFNRSAAFAFFVANVPPERLQGKLIASLKQGEAVLSASPNPSCRLDFPLSPRARSRAQGVSPSADGDKGLCPLTPAAFFEKTAAPKKLLYLLNASKITISKNFFRSSSFLQKNAGRVQGQRPWSPSADGETSVPLDRLPPCSNDEICIP